MGSERWRTEIDAFASQDRVTPPPSEPIVFTGSSTIRLWTGLEDRWPNAGIMNRGFGGARAEDCLYYLDETVLRYEPRQVVMYAGGNDLARGATPEAVAESLLKFAHETRRHRPVPFLFLAILPHRAFWSIVDKIKAANALLQDAATPDSGLRLVNVCDAMLALDNPPPEAFFVEDEIHLSKLGYAFLQACLEPWMAFRPE